MIIFRTVGVSKHLYPSRDITPFRSPRQKECTLLAEGPKPEQTQIRSKF